MKIESLKLRNFRNFSELDIEFGSGLIAFLGENGQGKTNLLESIYLLTRGQSFRPTETESLAKKGQEIPQAFVSASVKQGDLQSQVQFKQIGNKRKFLINGKGVRRKSLFEKFPTVLFSPECLAAIKDGPSRRRDLVDDFIRMHNALNIRRIDEFEKTLKMRNKILRDHKLDLRSLGATKQLLSSVDETYLSVATQLTNSRIVALREIIPLYQDAMSYISNIKNVDISVDYLISSESAMEKSEEQIEKSLLERMNQLQSSELSSGMTLVGPHKHDILFLFEGQNSRYFCSQGQQRALILSFKMAQIMYHYRVYQIHPLLLLDDVLSELDGEKRVNLIGFLKGIRSQIFLTTTELTLPKEMSEMELSRFKIQSGQLGLAEEF